MLKVSHPLHKTPAGHMRRRPEFSIGKELGITITYRHVSACQSLGMLSDVQSQCIMSRSKAWEVIGNSREKAPFATLEKKKVPLAPGASSAACSTVKAVTQAGIA